MSNTARRHVQRVLIASDGSDASVRAARYAAALIPDDGSAEIRILAVLSYGEYPEPWWEQDGTVDEEVRALERATDRPAGIIEAAGHKTSIVSRFGNPADEILEEIRSWQPHLVVLGSRGLTGPLERLGSVSQRVARRSNVPVLVVP